MNIADYLASVQWERSMASQEDCTPNVISIDAAPRRTTQLRTWSNTEIDSMR